MLWLGAAGLASASFVGVETELVDATEYGWTYRVYALFDAFDDEVVAVYGWAPAPMTLTVQAPLLKIPREDHGGGHQPVVFCGVSRFGLRQLVRVGLRGCRWNLGIESGRHGGVV